ncbi:MAG TPA: mercuric reductase [Longimicrobiales bacterium]|nr:mercuric reductase [Longimicrobiales bacterium]
MESFDAVVIGTGQAGKPLARALGAAGLRTAIVEKGRVGGTCVIDGCTPTKTMIASARVAHLARRGADFGVAVGDVSVDLARVRQRKRDIVDAFSSGGEEALREAENVELVFGTARFTADHRLRITGEDGDARELTAPRIFINTGTRPRVPELDGLDGVDWLDNASIMELAEVPRHLLVLGGGFIGLEFGQMFRRFGADVTIVEGSERLVRREDPEISEALADLLEEDGIRVRLSSEALEVRARDGVVRLRIDGSDGEEELTGSHLLVAVGRRPNTEELGLENTGIGVDDRGFIEVDDQLRTGVEGVWALGDVNRGPPFTHVSYDDYRVVERNVLGDGGGTRAGRTLAYTLFTDPQLGRVGMSEAEAREAGRTFDVARLSTRRVARAQETDERRGLMKALVDRESGRILGASILAPEGGEIAAQIQLAMLGGLRAADLRDGVFSHPTWSEALNTLFEALEPGG